MLIKNSRGPASGLVNTNWQSTPGPMGLNDSADANRPLRMPNQPGVNPFYLDAEVTLIAKGGKRRKRSKATRRRGGSSTTVLYIYDKTDRVVGEDILAKEIFKAGRKNMVSVASWDDLATAIKRHTSIDHLILSFHGYEGGLIVGGDSRYVDEANVLKLFQSKSGGSVPTINKISFVGCNVGGRPAKMATFARLFSANTVSGYTWYMVRQEITLDLPRGNSVADIKNILKPYADFVRPKLNPSAMAAATRSRDKKFKLLLMYGASTYSTIDKFPLDSRKKRNFKPVGEARQTSIAASKAKQAEADYDASPVTPFEKVIVTLQ